MAEPVYDRIGGGYAGGRREEPRIAARLARALGDADSVVNVGAGAVWRACSALALIGDAEREAGMGALSRDLASGEWRRRYGHLLELDELDLGYRVIIAQVTDRLPT